MYAIVEIGGKQYRVAKDTTIRTDSIAGETGKSVEFDRVLLHVDGDKVQVGAPTVKGAVIKATIASAGRDDKVIVFKKKRRKGYRVTRGHRQPFTELHIDKISVGGAKSTKPKAASAGAAAEKPAAKAKPKPKAAPKKDAAGSTDADKTEE